MENSGKNEAARAERYERMTRTPVQRLALELSAPTIISMLVTSLYNMADTFFVGKISTEATAAVGVVFSLMALIQALGFFCGHGSGNYLSRKLGAGDSRAAGEMAATGFVCALILGTIVFVAGEIFLDPFSRALGATDAIARDTQDYMRVILCGAPFMMSQLVVNNQLRFQGSAVYAMAGLVSGALVNIALDPLLIFGCSLGVTGAALATVISQLLSFVILWTGARRGANLRIQLKNTRLAPVYLRELVNGGAPSLFRQGLSSVAAIIMNTTAGALGGEAAIAGMSVANRVMMLLSSALIGFGQGFQPICAFNYGASLHGRVKDAFWFCVKYGAIFSLVVSAPCFAFANRVVEFFRDDAAVVAVGAVALRFQSSAFPLSAFIIMSNMMLQSIGKGVKASIMASARAGLFFIPFILILPRALGLRGVEMTQMCADVCAFALSLPLALSELKSMNFKK